MKEGITGKVKSEKEIAKLPNFVLNITFTPKLINKMLKAYG
jgi:hypothetical protein